MNPSSHLYFGLDDPVISTLYLKLLKRLITAAPNSASAHSSVSPNASPNASPNINLHADDAIHSPKERISFRDLVRTAVAHLQPQHAGLGLRYGEQLSLVGADTLGQLIMSCDTVTEAIFHLHKYRLLLGIPCDFSYEQSDLQDVTIGLTLFPQMIDPPEVLTHFVTETMLATFAKQTAWLSGKPFAFKRLDFAYAEPEYSSMYAEAFGCELRFNQAISSMTFEQQVLNYKIATADKDIKAFKRARCEAALRNREKHFAIEDRLRAVFTHNLPSLPSAEEAAERLNMSKSALHRKLQDNDLSFQRVLNNFKREQSEHLLTCTNCTVSEIAERIGFSDSSTFRRAFKTWTGLQPSQMRDKR